MSIYCINVSVTSFSGEILKMTKLSRGEMGSYLCIASNGMCHSRFYFRFAKRQKHLHIRLVWQNISIIPGVPPSVSKRIILSIHCEFFLYIYTFRVFHVIQFLSAIWATVRASDIENLNRCLGIHVANGWCTSLNFYFFVCKARRKRQQMIDHVMQIYLWSSGIAMNAVFSLSLLEAQCILLSGFYFLFLLPSLSLPLCLFFFCSLQRYQMYVVSIAYVNSHYLVILQISQIRWREREKMKRKWKVFKEQKMWNVSDWIVYSISSDFVDGSQ